MSCTRYAVLLLTATAVATIPRPSLAQSAGDGFLFHVPVATWTVRGGFDHAFASGDIFNFVTQPEFRDWVDQNNQPIEQTTSLRRVPVTLGVRHYLSSRGRSIGRFAWIPAARDTYVGLGAGLMQYRFHQVGDFVDFQTLNVFPDEFESKAWTPVLHALAGLDLGLGRFLLLNGEARYTWARGPMSRDYVGFKRIDLSGLAVTAGLSLRL